MTGLCQPLSLMETGGRASSIMKWNFVLTCGYWACPADSIQKPDTSQNIFSGRAPSSQFFERLACLRSQLDKTGQDVTNIIFTGRTMRNTSGRAALPDFTVITMKESGPARFAAITIDLFRFYIMLIHPGPFLGCFFSPGITIRPGCKMGITF